MTDQELLHMLRNNVGVSEAACRAANEAADRIEELVKERDTWREIAHNEAGEAEHNFETMLELSDKLAKAVEVMKSLQEDMLERSRAGMDTIHGEEYRIVNAGRTAWNDFCATLAELEGK